MNQTADVARLVRAVKVVRILDSAVVKAFVGAGGTDQDAVAGEVNAIGRAPWVDQLALGVKIFSAPDIDDDFLRVVAAKSLDDFRVVARGIGASEFLEFLEG